MSKQPKNASKVGMKYKKSGKPRKKSKVRAPSPRDFIVAQKHYIEGLPATRAVREAGFSPAYAHNSGRKVAKSERVLAALFELEGRINPGDLGKLAKARLHQKLVTPPRDPKAQLGYIRTAMETDGLLGGPSELHLHNHQTLPPVVQRMLESKMAELLRGSPEKTAELLAIPAQCEIPADPLPDKTDDLPKIPEPTQSPKERLTAQLTSKYARNPEDAKRLSAKVWNVAP